jgi:hypothetical protein
MRGEFFHADGWMGMTKQMVAYCNFTNPPKNVLLIEDNGTFSKIYKDFQA